MAESTVRLGTDGDLPGLAALDVLARPGSRRWHELARMLRGTGGCCLVAEHGQTSPGLILGYITLAADHFFGRDFVGMLVVADTHRRKGVGTRLLSAAMDRAHSSTVFTSTNESNTAMRALLGREGWLLSGTLVGLDEGDPELVYFRSTTGGGGGI